MVYERGNQREGETFAPEKARVGRKCGTERGKKDEVGQKLGCSLGEGGKDLGKSRMREKVGWE